MSYIKIKKYKIKSTKWNTFPLKFFPCVLTETRCQIQEKHMTFMVNLKLNYGHKLSGYFFCPVTMRRSPPKESWVRPRKIQNGKVRPRIQRKLHKSWVFNVPFVSEKLGVAYGWGPTLCTVGKLLAYQDFCSSVTAVLSAQYQPFCSVLNDNPIQYSLLGIFSISS